MMNETKRTPTSNAPSLNSDRGTEEGRRLGNAYLLSGVQEHDDDRVREAKDGDEYDDESQRVRETAQLRERDSEAKCAPSLADEDVLSNELQPRLAILSEDELNRPSYFFNRELSWLDFNQRVIVEAYDNENPFLEQLNFLAIGSSNLDEFFMVRVAGVYDQYLANIEISETKTYMTPLDLLSAISQKNHQNVKMQYDRYNQLANLLPQVQTTIKGVSELNPDEVAEIERVFERLIMPTLSPLGIDAYRPFPHLTNKLMNILVRLETDGQSYVAIVPIPALLDRYFTIDAGVKKTIVMTEDIISHFIHRLFEGQTISYTYPFRITRNADFDIIEDGASDLLEVIEDYVKKRKNGMAIRVEVDISQLDDFSERQVQYLLNALDLHINDVYLINGPLDLTFLFNLRDQMSDGFPELTYQPYESYLNPAELGESLFSQARKQDLFFHHPYDSFQPIVSLVEHAAGDSQTISIKQTLYRVSKNSPIIAALKKAAENGKEVTVLVELKARFDEENNVFWARELEDAGCHVLYGVTDLKTHSKITLITRREADRLQQYVHLGTGNYNDKTANLYTDMGIITTHEGITSDATNFFNYLSGYSERPIYQHLHVSPFEIRDSLMDYIEDEIDFHKTYGNGRIIAKMNSLTDKELIKKLYEASHAGVKIDLIVRGICCLKPGIKGISETIHVRSIVGRLLEHSRIYFFNRNGNHHLFLSSADMMTRNMTKRVEIEFPILDDEIEQEIFDYLELQLADTMKAHILQNNGDYLTPDKSLQQISSQDILIRRAQAESDALKIAEQKAAQVIEEQMEQEGAGTAIEAKQVPEKSRQSVGPIGQEVRPPSVESVSWWRKLLQWLGID